MAVQQLSNQILVPMHNPNFNPNFCWTECRNERAVSFTDSVTKQEFWRRDHLRLQTAGDPFAQVERFIIILIMSAPSHTNERQAIRQTWLSLLAHNSVALGRSNIRAMKDPTNAFNTLVIHYWFVCGHDKENDVELSLKTKLTFTGIS